MLRVGAALCWLCLLAGAAAGRVVTTRQGRLQGTLLPASGRLPRAVHRFLGVPYAAPPLGAGRFGPTRAPPPWAGVRDAASAAPACPQRLPGEAALRRAPPARRDQLRAEEALLRLQSEDCLYLNVFVPDGDLLEGEEEEEEVLRPVVVVVAAGEDFSRGVAAALDVSLLASIARLVVVTVQYRLGPLGFLNSNPAPRRRARVANYGLMDQLAALHWLQENVAQFGGDPRHVTLLGHGAGAACVHFLMASPAVTPGLFRRAVLLSGSALSSWALVRDPSRHAVSLARQLNCSVPEDLVQDHEDIVDCLRSMPLDQLLQADVETPMFLSTWGPSADGVVVLPGEEFQPRDRYAVLLGLATSEAAHLFSEEELRVGFEAERRDLLLRAYVRAAYSRHLAEIFYTVSNEYTEWDRTALHPASTRDATVAALGDARYAAPLLAAADLFAAAGGSAFFFVFDHPQRPAPVYGELLAYMLGAPLADGAMPLFPANYSRLDASLSESLVAFLASFAATGDPGDQPQSAAVMPVTQERNRFRGLSWDPYDSLHQRYLEVGVKPRVRSHYRAHKLSVWLRLVPELERAGDGATPRHDLLREPPDTAPPPGDLSPDTADPEAPASTCTPASPEPGSPPHDPPDHTAALGLSVAVGCSLLVLNVLVLAGVCRRQGRPAPGPPPRQGVVTILLEAPCPEPHKPELGLHLSVPQLCGSRT